MTEYSLNSSEKLGSSFLKILFRAYKFIIKNISRILIIFKKQRKMTNDFLNHYEDSDNVHWNVRTNIWWLKKSLVIFLGFLKMKSFWFCSIDDATDCGNDTNTDDLQSFKYKAKLLKHTVSHPYPNRNNGILKNPKFAVPLKYLSNFWLSLKMSLIIWKVELKLKWAKHLCFIWSW